MAKSTLTARMVLLKNLIEHAKTGEDEREAARHALTRLMAKAEEVGVAVASGYTDHRVYGAKYDRTQHLPTAAYAAKIRAEIKVRRDLRKAKAAPGSLSIPDLITDAPATIRFFVKVDHHASITITIKGVPESWWRQEPYDGYRGADTHTVPGPELNELAADLAALMAEYNYDGSDVMTDYFDVNFYAHVDAGPCPDRGYPYQVNTYHCGRHAQRQREQDAERAEWEARQAAAT